ncbi:hypothetical protein HMPREF3207_03955 [Citrobacter koseri]|nr:hypothetical protein HMPREF3207_03955 [Citrobacter koseri]
MIGQQKGAIHIDSNEFDSHEFPGLNESRPHANAIPLKKQQRKGGWKGEPGFPFCRSVVGRIRPKPPSGKG